MTDSQKIFEPRPEAQATTWDELMPPVQMAVHDLLVRIYGAHQSVRDKNKGKSADSSVQQTGNCFLVYGSRGTGKTTVLLNAQKAVCKKEGEKFFKETANRKETAAETKARKNAETNAKELYDRDGVIWLDILNLEPIPSEANLLTVLLTQVRNALHSHCDKRQREQRSVFEEEANSAQQQLNRLIGDTTLMWQNISEPDTRNISARQVKAADIYAGFQKKFNEAMDKLIEELSDTRSSDSKVSIVLPIDNIDRSTEHLQSIVKLAQLVSHPNLWLVMAGDRVEVETFLERGYWKELIRSSDGAGARGKIDSDGEDEALLMARRQANATAQKLWPANHRVEIGFLKPEETLGFEYKQNSTEKSAIDEKDDKTIKSLLKQIKIPTTDDERKQKSNCNISMLNLFDVTKKVEEIGIKDVKKLGETELEELTRAAYHGLLLPARSVLELWQLLDWLIISNKDNSNTGLKPDFSAEKVVRTMLRNAISCSALPSAVTQKLQNDVIRRGETGGTVLFFGDTVLKARPMCSPNHDFEYAFAPVISKTSLSRHSLRSQLVISNIEDIALFLQLNYSPINRFNSPNEDVKNQYPQHFLIENVSEKQGKIELPPLVAAWLMVLYDILMFAEDDASSWVSVDNLDIKWLNVSVNHSIVYDSVQTGKLKIMNFNLNWNAPCWGFFLGRNIFRLRWYNFRREIVKHLPENQQQILVPRLLATGWIFCVLKTFRQLIKSVSQKKKYEKYDFIDEIKFPLLDNKTIFWKSLNEFEIEIEIIRNTSELYKKIKDEQLTPQKNVAYTEITTAMAQWLEEELIYFLSYVYVPLPNSMSRLNLLWSKLDDNCLLRQHWKDNRWFILETLDEKLTDAKQSEEKYTAMPSHQYIASLGELADLHNFNWS